MDHWQVSKKLRDVGYSHGEVRDIWAYAWNEQQLPLVGRKRRPWEALALDEIGLTPQDVEFPTGWTWRGGKQNYF